MSVLAFGFRTAVRRYRFLRTGVESNDPLAALHLGGPFPRKRLTAAVEAVRVERGLVREMRKIQQLAADEPIAFSTSQPTGSDGPDGKQATS